MVLSLSICSMTIGKIFLGCFLLINGLACNYYLNTFSSTAKFSLFCCYCLCVFCEDELLSSISCFCASLIDLLRDLLIYSLVILIIESLRERLLGC
jgi:hypothetical protein